LKKEADAPEPSSGALVGGRHRLAVRVYYEDTDFSGRVYHCAFVCFLGRGRTELLRLCGISHTELLQRPEPITLAVTRMELRFTAAAVIDDALVVETAFRALRGARLMLTQTIQSAEKIVVDAVGAVCLASGGRARRLPDLASKLGLWIDSSPTP
jgi:acyl-CoA thioester hydrolase